MIRRVLWSVAACLALTLPANAASVFYDDFSGDVPGLQTALGNFDIFGGVDVVAASNGFGISTPGGNVVDLDGSPGPGMIMSKNAFSFGAGDTVTLSMLLGGAQRGSIIDNFFFGFSFLGVTTIADSLVSGQFSGSAPGTEITTNYMFNAPNLSGSAGFVLTNFSFTAVTAGSLNFFIGTESHDNIGPLITNVNLDISAVPLPAGGLLLLAGLGALAGLRRKRRA